jgi:1-acyl-sn-glycerol-3-phosphate acyltransferase
VIITKEWVWNNPLLGAMARYADYYCAAEGYEGLKEKVRGIYESGCSIIIFPEGQRSYTGDIDRFHKGAFLFADEFQADLLPVVIRGSKDSVPRGTRVIRASTVTLKFLPRIKPEDVSFGATPSDRAHNIRRYIMEEYEKI